MVNCNIRNINSLKCGEAENGREVSGKRRKKVYKVKKLDQVNKKWLPTSSVNTSYHSIPESTRGSL